MKDKIIIIPTYNERENVANMITQVFALEGNFEILIVDDSSPDGTASIVKEEMAKYPERLHLLERKGKLGLGTAYIAGFKWCLSEGYNYIFEMDCDFSHPLEALPRLYAACHDQGYDVAVGSRYIKGGGVKDWPRNRIMMSRWASYYVRFITWLKVHDTTAGFVCYRREVLEAIDLDAIGFKLTEVPIIFINRKLGVSKMSSSIFGEAFTGVLKLRLWHTFKGYPRRKAN